MAKAKKVTRKAPANFDENPVWGDTDFARARPASEVVPAIVAAAKRRGRPRAEHPKVALTLRLDSKVVAAFRATGKGWQGRINAVLAKKAQMLDRMR